MRILRYLLWTLGIILFLALAVSAWWVPRHGEAWLDRTIRERITQVIDKASLAGYHFSMDEFEMNVRARQLTITGVDLSFEDSLVQRLENGSVDYLFSATVERIELRDISFWKLLLWNEFRVQTFELNGPALNYLLSGAQVDLADPFERLSDPNGPTISLLQADSLFISNATANVKDLGERLPQLQLRGLNLESTGVRVNMGAPRTGVRVNVDGAELHFDSVHSQLADGDEIRVGTVDLSLENRTGTIRGFQLLPRNVANDSVRHAVIDLSMDSITLIDLDVDELISHQVLHLGQAAIYGLDAEVGLDKTLPQAPLMAKPLPPARLLALGFPVRVDSLSVHQARLNYQERSDITGRWGTILFSELDAKFLNITNERIEIAEQPQLTGYLQGLILDTAKFTLAYNAELDGSENFSVTATVAALPLPSINGLSAPLLRMDVNTGMLDSLNIRFDADAEKAAGTMWLHYTDLLVGIEPGTPLAVRRSMFGNVLHTMLKDAYGGGLSAERERNFNITRDQNRSMITYLWHAVREGFIRNLVPEAKDRMRHMLRTDMEKWKQQRDKRRAQKHRPSDQEED